MLLVFIAAVMGVAASSQGTSQITWFDEPPPEKRMTLVGEIHGIAANYDVLYDLTVDAASDGQDVVLALELPGEDQSALDRFWRSSDENAKERLVSATDWCGLDDGRASVELLNMLDRLKQTRGSDRIYVALFDTRSDTPPPFDTIAGLSNYGSARLAVELARLYERHDAAKIIVSVGNHHASLAYSDFRPEHGGGPAIQAAQLLTGMANTLAVSYRAGERYGCRLDGCGLDDMWNSNPNDSGYHGVIATGESVAITPLSASRYCGDQ